MSVCRKWIARDYILYKYSMVNKLRIHDNGFKIKCFIFQVQNQYRRYVKAVKAYLKKKISCEL